MKVTIYLRKELTTDYKLKKTDKYHRHYKIHKNSIIFLLTDRQGS